MADAENSGLTVHHLNDSRSQRILWLLEELEVPYQIKKYERDADRLAPKELSAVHPLGTAPVITDGDITLAESGAIVEYLLRKYGQGDLRATDTLSDLYFTHYAEGSLMPLLVFKLIFQMAPQKAPFIIRPFIGLLFGTLARRLVDPRLKLHADMIEKHLSKDDRLWFAGGLGPTTSDYMMTFPLEAWLHDDPAANGVLGPKTRAYVQRVHERALTFAQAIEKGGPYAFAE
ncbi:thioredoxin-like protein [Panus rudis PR-1116 ss-1]|nr:thioredoxin-like protein [Panus rudis PR-1116 ss-1]KAI0070932.1 thioredoxin-like protein [Panus rudis PR-1116 ss-1]